MWVDKADALHNAICHIEECKVIGIDCEWKPNYIKGRKPNKVIIDKILSTLCNHISSPITFSYTVSAVLVVVSPFFFFFFLKNLIRTVKQCAGYFTPLE